MNHLHFKILWLSVKIVQAVRDQIRNAKACIELNMTRDVKGEKRKKKKTTSLGMAVIKGRLEKMWILFRRK